MKLSKFGRPQLAVILSLGSIAAVTACGGRAGTNNTIDYVYVTNSRTSTGQINVYYADSQSGGLKQIPDSPYPSGGSNPVALVTAPNFKNLYVVNDGLGGSAGSGIVQFAIGTDAKLYPQHTYPQPVGSSLSVPNSVAINAAGTFLFVTYTYIADSSSSGALVVYPINTDGSLGTPVTNGALPFYPLSTGTARLVPTAIHVLTQDAGGTFVYVADQNVSSGAGSISAFSVDATGALTYVPCSPTTSECDVSGNGTFTVNVAPSAPTAITSTPRGLYLYATDSTRNQLLSYTVQPSGQLIASPAIQTDGSPDAVTVDPHGEYVYVANYAANNINAYSIGATAVLTPVGSYGTGTGPTCVFVEPAHGSYVYTTNFLDNTVSGLNLDPTTGALAPVQNTPFIAAGQPTCIAATPHGTNSAITSAN